MVDPLMRLEAVEAAVGLKKSTLYAMIKAGEFPRPVKIGPALNGWPSSEIEQWISAKIAERDQAAA